MPKWQRRLVFLCIDISYFWPAAFWWVIREDNYANYVLIKFLCANFPSLCKKLIDNRFDCSHNSTTRRIKYLHGKALCEHCVFVLYAVGTRYQCSQIQYVQNNVYLIYSAIAFPSQFYQTAFGFAQFTLFSLLFCFRICIARFKYFVYLQCI